MAMKDEQAVAAKHSRRNNVYLGVIEADFLDRLDRIEA